MQAIQDYVCTDAAEFRQTILPRNRPVVLRGIASAWPAVAAGRASPQALCDYLGRFDKGGSVLTFVAAPEVRGRFWYNADMRGLNFHRVHEPLSNALQRVLSQLGVAEPMAVYAGAASIPDHIPGFVDENALAVPPQRAVPRIWAGNAVTVSTHNDLSENIACVVAGRRRFTLFPPEELKHLYIGPLEFNFAGQPVSMVDIRNPDFERYPLFRKALDAALVAELEPGDGIYIPYMWWHHVESLENFNVLVNYWWDDGRPWLGSPFEAMIFGLLTIGDLPPEKREIWHSYFEHYVFRPGGRHPAEHLAPDQRGIMSKPTPALAKFIRTALVKMLSG